MNRILYICGEPGTGKTTMVNRLTKGTKPVVQKIPNVTWTEYSSDVCQIGHSRENFGGTDALGMAAQNHVLAWLETMPYKYILAEGDRLANMKFFEKAKAMGYTITVYFLEVEPEALEERRAKRNAAIGKEQNERWLATRRTKVANLKAALVEAHFEVVDLVGDRSPKEIARDLISHPVGRAIRRAAR